MAASSHAASRAIERLTEAGIDPEVILDRAARIAAQRPSQDVAVLMVTLPTAYGDQSHDLDRGSNGNEVWAVLRQGMIATIMLRRSNQPKDRYAFGVTVVIRDRA